MKNNKIIFLSILLLCFVSSKAQSLDSLLNKAYLNNPEINALRLQYEAALQKGPQVSQLQDPTIGFGVPILRTETRLGSQVMMISATQMFPWFGTLKAKKDVVMTMAKSKYERIAAAKLNIDFKLKTTYYKLVLIKEQQLILSNNIRLFEAIEKVTLAKVESGKTLFSDVLIVQMKMDELQNQILILESQKSKYSSEINGLLNIDLNTELKTDILNVKLTNLDYDLASFKVKIESNHPLINQIDWNIETSQNELELNTKLGLPTFGLGIDYSLINSRTDANPNFNGRDILIPKLMLNVPIYRKKYAAKQQEETLKIEAYGFQKEQITNNLLSRIQAFKSEYDAAKLEYKLAQNQIKKLKSAYDILLTDYSTKGQRFNELMQILNDINKYEIELLKASYNTHLVKFKIEQLTNF